MLNIKNREAHELAQAIARETGESMTRAVTEALRERLERLQRKRCLASVDEILAIGQRCAAGLAGPPIDHADFLYDGHGLPE